MEILIANDNQLTALPRSVRKLKKLKTVILRNNAFPPEARRQAAALLPGAKLHFE